MTSGQRESVDEHTEVHRVPKNKHQRKDSRPDICKYRNINKNRTCSRLITVIFIRIKSNAKYQIFCQTKGNFVLKFPITAIVAALEALCYMLLRDIELRALALRPRVQLYLNLYLCCETVH